MINKFINDKLPVDFFSCTILFHLKLLVVLIYHTLTPLLPLNDKLLLIIQNLSPGKYFFFVVNIFYN